MVSFQTGASVWSGDRILTITVVQTLYGFGLWQVSLALPRHGLLP